ncbi:hypothetical protein OPQ81_002511 [Rhizoctonia solani]|nr:hypothetical protein OPQ81_002511 [Rhizoctonia solani]
MLVPLSQFIWGRPLEQYVGSYGLGVAQPRATHSTTARRLADAAVKRICHYDGASGASLRPLVVTQDVTIGSLDAVLRMSHDPGAYHIFLTPKLAGGCIALMSTIKSGQKSSPFSYEYGYLCFRILSFSLCVSLLFRSGESNLRSTIKLLEDPRYVTCLASDILSAQVARALHDAIMEDDAVYGCDWIIGRGASKSRPRYDPLLSPEQNQKLVDMIWEDRVDFLRVMTLTFTPELAGLMFLNWRYACREHKPEKPNYDLLRRTSEIHWRCMLITPTNQDILVIKIADRFSVMSNHLPGREKSLFQKSEGSRDILEAYISRLAPTNLIMYDPVPIVMLTLLLEIVVPNLEPGLDTLFPTLFRVTIVRLWEALRGEQFMYQPLVVGIALIFEHFKAMFRSLGESEINRSTVARILEVLDKEGFLDLIASLLVSLDPNAEEDTPEDNTNFNIRNTIRTMVDQLGLMAPPDLLQLYFQDYAANWPKIYNHFQQLRFGVDDPADQTEGRRRRNKHYDACMELWLESSETLEQMDNIQQIRKISTNLFVVRQGTGRHIVKSAANLPTCTNPAI